MHVEVGLSAAKNARLPRTEMRTIMDSMMSHATMAPTMLTKKTPTMTTMTPTTMQASTTRTKTGTATMQTTMVAMMIISRTMTAATKMTMLWAMREGALEQ